LFIYLLPIYFRFDPRVGSYEKSKMLCFFLFLLIYLYQAREVREHVFVCSAYQF
jgi:hypothetical protein